jgi:hypothetical protein
MATQRITNIANDGVELFTVTSDPNGVLLASSGSVALRTDNGNVGIYINDNDLTAWVSVPTFDAAGDLDLTGVFQITVRDNNAAALAIGSTGLLNLLVFDTLNGAEQVEYNGVLPFLINTGGLNVVAGTVAFPNNTVNVATSAIAALAGTVTASLTLRVTHPGGAVAVDTVLPVRAGGWRVLDALVVASAAGGAAAAVAVQTAAAAAVSSNLIIDAGVVNGTVVRTTSLLNTVFASGATIRVQGINAPASSNVFISIAPL